MNNQGINSNVLSIPKKNLCYRIILNTLSQVNFKLKINLVRVIHLVNVKRRQT